jgi:hypothetical protein
MISVGSDAADQTADHRLCIHHDIIKELELDAAVKRLWRNYLTTS